MVKAVLRGISAWTAQRREAYANDQGAESSLVAVTARSNRSKADQDPAEWRPPARRVALPVCSGVGRHEAPLGSGRRRSRTGCSGRCALRLPWPDGDVRTCPLGEGRAARLEIVRDAAAGQGRLRQPGGARRPQGNGGAASGSSWGVLGGFGWGITRRSTSGRYSTKVAANRLAWLVGQSGVSPVSAGWESVVGADRSMSSLVAAQLASRFRASCVGEWGSAV
jgi:hypothetical protein